MGVYEYKGLDKVGKATAGLVDADNAKAARIKLRRQGVFPTDLHEQRKGSTIRGSGLNIEIDFSQYLQFVSKRDISVLTRQLATLLGASVPLAETLTALVDQTEKSKLKVVLSDVKEKVTEGTPLADALAAHPAYFDDLYVHMVRAGERSGALSAVLKRLAVFSEGQVKLQGKVLGALIYPALMGLVGTGILFGLFLFVVPKMRGLIEDYGGEDGLPYVTQLVFLVGDTLTSGGIILVAAALAAAFVGVRRYIRGQGKRRWHQFLLRLPVVGMLNRKVAVSRFCRTLSTLMVSGVPIISALQIVKDVVGNVVMQEAVQTAIENITEGQSIATPLKASGQFPPMVTHMIAIGERTGELEAMLTNVANAYETEVESTVEGLTATVGPAMIVLMGGVVFVIALGLLLPLMNITQGFA